MSMTDDRAGLLACPFCGSSAVSHRYVRDGRQMFCQGCGASVAPTYHGSSGDTIERAVAAWNTRAADAGVREALSVLLVDPDGEEADEDCELCGGRGTLDAYTERSNGDRFEGRDEIGCPACIELSHSRIARAVITTPAQAAGTTEGL